MFESRAWPVMRLMITSLHGSVAWCLWCTLFAVRGDIWISPHSVQNLCLIRYLGFGFKAGARVLRGCSASEFSLEHWLELNARFSRSQELLFSLSLGADLLSGIFLGSGGGVWQLFKDCRPVV